MESETLRHVALLPEGVAASFALLGVCVAACVYVCVYVCFLTFAYSEDPVSLRSGETGVNWCAAQPVKEDLH